MTEQEHIELWELARTIHEARKALAWGKANAARREPWPEFSYELATALLELSNAVFGSQVGNELDVYADYDRLTEMQRRCRDALAKFRGGEVT